MPEKRYPEKTKPLPELEISVSEILAANGRSFEPYIKTFRQNGENVTAAGLGTLVGVFEISERSEDSAYIVNFLASVAKKEYFINPRRGAVESFEGALHKINLALAELVKHGNVAWLGKFHGVIGVFEKNNFHFSAAGEGKILLLRNEGLSDIAEGLASEESSAHPLKTFVEISSGRLLPDDKVILASPEIFRLFSPEDLRKNALRMDDTERFRQFLRTAIVNELDMAGVIVVDLSEKPLSPLPKPHRKKETEKTDSAIENVFSKAAFKPAIPKETAHLLPSSAALPTEKTIEYVDSKTGHIYVQGDTPGEPASHPFLERASLLLQDMASSAGRILNNQKKWLRKARKQSAISLQSLSGEARSAARTIARSLRHQWKNRVSQKKKTDIRPFSPQENHTGSLRQESFSESPAFSASSEANHQPDNEDIPPFLKERLAAFYRKNTPKQPMETEISATAPRQALTETLRSSYETFLFGLKHTGDFLLRWTRFVLRSVGTIGHGCLAFYGRLEPLSKRIVLGGIIGLFIICSGLFFLFVKNDSITENETTITPQEESPAVTTLSIENEKNARHTGEITEFFSADEPLLASVILNNDLFLISSGNIFFPREGKRYALPDNRRALLAAAMEDLRLIFIVTEDGGLFAWSPLSKTFVRNDLSLPENSRIRSIGTYLTYLYVLDSENDQIYRFPRAEGGFGAPTIWLKNSLSLDDTASFAVSENIFLSTDRSSVRIFSRGRETGTLESPTAPLQVRSLSVQSALGHISVLDPENKRVVVWNQDGTILSQYFSERFGSGLAVSINEKTGEVFVLTPETVLSFRTTNGS